MHLSFQQAQDHVPIAISIVIVDMIENKSFCKLKCWNFSALSENFMVLGFGVRRHEGVKVIKVFGFSA